MLMHPFIPSTQEAEADRPSNLKACLSLNSPGCSETHYSLVTHPLASASQAQGLQGWPAMPAVFHSFHKGNESQSDAGVFQVWGHSGVKEDFHFSLSWSKNLSEEPK